MTLQTLSMLIKLTAICLISLNPGILKSNKIATMMTKNYVVMHTDHNRFFVSDVSCDVGECVSQQAGVSLPPYEVRECEARQNSENVIQGDKHDERRNPATQGCAARSTCGWL
ncbi:MAG: hypothetical protein ACOH2K_04580 [Burkholderiaceae bacterium]